MANIKEPSMLDVFEKNKYSLPQASKASKSWFDQQILLLHHQHINGSNVLKTAPQFTSIGKIMPGKLYLYRYDAKYKSSLPYWDMFPLVFPYEKTKDGFYGLNFHYLPYQLRIKLLDKMMVFATNKNMDENTRLRYSWQLISGISKFKFAEPCIHRYLNSHIRTQCREITANNWATAMMLPVEGFVGANKAKVWQESKRSINK